jgi:hypothetical protein
MGDVFSGLGGILSAPFNLLGASPNNAGFKATGANVINPVDEGMVRGGFGQNADLIRALQGQNAIQNQSNVFNQLQGVANGQGPNPALAQHNISTGENIQHQAALMAGQRGASANPGLIGRQIGQQGAQIQQQGAGQSALLQALQQLNALGQLGGMAGQQVGQLQNATFGNTEQLLGGAGATNQANVANQSNLNETNQRMAGMNANNTSNLYGGFAKAASAGVFPKGKAHGGEIENPKLAQVPKSDRMSEDLYPSHLRAARDVYGGNSYKQGGDVPGQAPVQGDSAKNDLVKTLLSPGEFVIPRSIMQSDNPIAGAAKMIADHQKKSGKGSENKKMEGDFKMALRKAIEGRKKK